MLASEPIGNAIQLPDGSRMSQGRYETIVFDPKDDRRNLKIRTMREAGRAAAILRRSLLELRHLGMARLSRRWTADFDCVLSIKPGYVILQNFSSSLAALGLGLSGVDGLSCGPISYEGPGDTNDEIKPNP